MIFNPCLQRILDEMFNLKIKIAHLSGSKKVEPNDITKCVYNRKKYYSSVTSYKSLVSINKFERDLSDPFQL